MNRQERNEANTIAGRNFYATMIVAAFITLFFGVYVMLLMGTAHPAHKTQATKTSSITAVTPNDPPANPAILDTRKAGEVSQENTSK
jgi:hypothetical protein